jgi:hypothetical protein
MPYLPSIFRRSAPVAASACLLVATAACGGSGSDVFGSDGEDGEGGAGATSGPGGPGGPGATTTAAGTPTSTGTGAVTNSTTGPGGTQSSSGTAGGGGGEPCASGPDDDADGDGATPSTGDCNDCDAAVGPTIGEIAGNGTDDDCDGVVDETGACDGGLPVANGDPLTAAQAMGLCATVDADGFGVADARWVRADGSLTTQGVQGGVLATFGPNVSPLEGDRVLALSSGHARLPGTADACGSSTCQATAGFAPPGFPQSTPNCPTANTTIADDIGLEVTLRAPANATGYRYRFRFYSFEFPEYVCTQFTDQFVVLATPAPAGATNGNLSAVMGQPTSVNLPIGSCSSCQPWAEQCQLSSEPDVVCPPVPSPCCPDGAGALAGTGFDQWATNGAGATAWLETRAPITGGDEVTLRFVIWDTGDSALDSTVVLDDFAWISDPGVTLETVRVAD